MGQKGEFDSIVTIMYLNCLEEPLNLHLENNKTRNFISCQELELIKRKEGENPRRIRKKQEL